jgi:GNAT superfamily N-acetyltransferase
MSLEIIEVKTPKQLKAFIDFPNRLYKDNPYYVPALRMDERSTLIREKNPAFDYCEARYWLAYREGRVVGRIAAILNHAYIRKWKNPYMRFGWIDFEEDELIARALLGQVEDWARERGMAAVHGPLGFTDLDQEGMLVEGFDRLSTLATIYNNSYYPQFLEKIGYSKDTDWVEFLVKVPETMPEKLERLCSAVMKRYGLQMVGIRRAKDLLPYAKDVFRLINEAYSHLYGVVPLTEKQILYYTKQYFSFIRPEYLPLVTDSSGNLIAFGISMPSLSVALQKARGKLLPFGFAYILRALKKNRLADLYLVAVDKRYQKKGVVALLMYEMTKSYIQNGIKFAETNPELEGNLDIRSIWEHYETTQHKRRRCYIRYLDSKKS